MNQRYQTPPAHTFTLLRRICGGLLARQRPSGGSFGTVTYSDAVFPDLATKGAVLMVSARHEQHYDSGSSVGVLMQSASQAAIVNHVLLYGAVVATMDLNPDLNGFYNKNPTAVYTRVNVTAGSVPHAVAIVGYNLTATTPYWIVRNSWGPTWGDGGYFRVAIGASGLGLQDVYGLTWTSECCYCCCAEVRVMMMMPAFGCTRRRGHSVRVPARLLPVQGAAGRYVAARAAADWRPRAGVRQRCATHGS